jgi:hypothetical protein
MKVCTLGLQAHEGNSILVFMRDHLDLRYDHASEYNPSSPRDGTTYSSLMMVVR